MSTTTRSDALRALAHRVKDMLPAEVDLLDAHPYEADDNVHVAIIADVDDARLRVCLARPLWPATSWISCRTASAFAR
jgi:hypothetical protein